MSNNISTKKSVLDARRTRMREFQTQLLERMQAARSGTDNRVSRLGVMVGQERYLLDLETSGEIISVEEVTQVPLTHEWYLGLINVRGDLMSVIDFACFQGRGKTLIDGESRIVALNSSLGLNVGLLVSRVFGLCNIAEMDGQPIVDHDAWVTQCYRDREENIWMELDLALMVHEPRFLRVGL